MSSERKPWSFLSKMAKKHRNGGADDYHDSDSEDASDGTTSKAEEKEKKLEAPDEKEATMSRGLRPEMDVDFDKLRSLMVYDERGNEVRFMELFVNHKTIIIFTRHLLDFITKEYVEDLAIIPVKHLQDANVNLVVIAPAPYKFIKSFKTLTNYRYSLYCDPDREIYKALGLRENIAIGSLKYSKHVKSGAVTGVLKSVWRAMQSQEYQGNTKQQGGAFILGPGEQVHFHHQDANNADHAHINDLLIEAGVQPVSFPKDQRVITV